MNMQKIVIGMVLALTACLLGMGSAFAGPFAGADIIYVQQAAAEADTFIPQLKGAGYNVISDGGLLQEIGQGNGEGFAAHIDELNAAKLIIFSADTGSGNYNGDGGVSAIAGVTAPILVMSAYLIREDRTGLLLDGTNVNQADADSTAVFEANDPGHAIFDGITLGAGNTLSIFDAAKANGDFVGSWDGDNHQAGTILLTPNIAGTVPAGSGPSIIHWAAGTLNGNTPADTNAGERMYFIGYTAGNTLGVEGSPNLNADGLKLFDNIVEFLAGPPPTDLTGADIIYIQQDAAEADTFIPRLKGLPAGYNVVSDGGLLQEIGQGNGEGFAAHIDELNAAKLIIFSADTGSGNYNGDGGVSAIAGVTAPILVMSAYLIREDRTGLLLDGTNVNQADADSTAVFEANDPGHAIFDGITLGAGNTLSIFDAAKANGDFVGSWDGDNHQAGTILLTPNIAGTVPAGSGPSIIHWAAGTLNGNTPADTNAGERMYFIGYTAGNTLGVEGSPNLNADGLKLFDNIVTFLIGGAGGDGDGDGGGGSSGVPVAGMPVAGALGLGLVAAACALGGSMFLRKK